MEIKKSPLTFRGQRIGSVILQDGRAFWVYETSEGFATILFNNNESFDFADDEEEYVTGCAPARTITGISLKTLKHYFEEAFPTAKQMWID